MLVNHPQIQVLILQNTICIRNHLIDYRGTRVACISLRPSSSVTISVLKTLILIPKQSQLGYKMMMMMMMTKISISTSPIFSSLRSSSTNRSSTNFMSLLSTINHSKFSIVSASSHGSQHSSFSEGDSFFRSVISSMEQVYLNRNPTARAILELVRSTDANQICYDHLAFRTFGVNGHGIESMSKLFLDFGYTEREELRFPKKKLKALWFSPPASRSSGSGVHGPLPRVFISELLVDQMSPEAQEIIRKYTGLSGAGHKHSAVSSALGCLTWPKPSHLEFQQLARESEYAAWTLVNGYTLNHVTISTHRLKPPLNDIDNLNRFIQDKGFKLNSEGGVLKVSPDGLLLQSSTVADSVAFEFCDGFNEAVPCSYIEFAQRLVLPQYKDLPRDKVEEVHRRDGFEVGNADKIFESTSKDQLTRRA